MPWQSAGEALDSLLRFLMRAESFALAFLRCNVPVERERIVSDLVDALKRNSRHSRVLRLEREVVDLRAEIAGTEPPMKPGEVLFILGFERSIPSEGSAPALDQLNMSRELFRDFRFPLVLVLPEYALTRIAREALDFWAWRAGVFETFLAPERVAELHSELLDNLEGSSESLSIEGKKARLEVLRELLVEYEASKKVHEEERARLFVEIASLSWSLGEWRQARNAAVVALAVAETSGDISLKGRMLHFLGVLEQARGDYEAAISKYRESLRIKERSGDEAGMAYSYHQLGNVAYLRADYASALAWYRKALEINEKIDNRAGMVLSYHQLGMLAQTVGDYEQSLRWYRKALGINEEIGNRPGVAATYHQLGLTAQALGDYEQAWRWYQSAAQIDEELGNHADLASTYHQLGRICQLRGDYDAALDWYRRAVRLDEALGNRAGMASTYHQLGRVAQDHGDYELAFDWYRKSLQINEALGNRAGMALGFGQMAVLLARQDRIAEAVPLTLRSLAIHSQLQSPNIQTDLQWLRRQRDLLGDERFRAILSEHLDADSLAATWEMIEQAAHAAQA